MSKAITAVVALLLVAPPLAAQPSPPARIYHSMVSLGADRGVLVFGGVTRHGWTMDLHDVWRLRTTSMSWQRQADLDGVDMYSAALDTQSQRVIVLALDGGTWAFDPASAQWQRMRPPQSPSFRCGQRTVYDSESDRVILFGGFGCTSVQDPVFGDTWAYDYDSDTWEDLRSSSAPPARMYHGMGYDPESDRVLVWGGRVRDSSVWSFDYNARSWQEHPFPGGPSGIRAYHTMTYDPTQAAFVVFGGLSLEEPLSVQGALQGDTWLLSPTDAWSRVEATVAPQPRSHHAAVYDPELGRVLIFGGEVEAPYSGRMVGEIWSFHAAQSAWVLAR
jgi:hypothetical protein